jgi:hypothetical protein
MARFRLCRFCGDMHALHAWPHNCLPDKPARSDFPAPFVISDSLGGINGLYHHAALKRVDSKSEFRRLTKETGCIELGNEYDAATRPRDIEIKQDVIEAGVNDALHEMGISSENDVGDFVL